MAPDALGRLWLDAVGVWLGVAGGEIVCIDAAGQRLGDYAAEAWVAAGA